MSTLLHSTTNIDEFAAPVNQFPHKIISISTIEYRKRDSPKIFDYIGAERPPGKNKKADWRIFVEKFAGSLADSPIQRGDQGI
jgi:hypothetical protein